MYTLRNYSEMLENALKFNYKFILFDQARLNYTKERLCLLRHDIDADLDAAYKMAKVEAELGIRATYFLMTRSPVYNLSARFNHQLVQNIISLGHGIGLHYDQGFLPGIHKSEEEWISLESEWLQNVFNVSIDVVSFHQPGPAVLQGNVDTGKRINTYNTEHLSGYKYFSDSNRQFSLIKSVNGDKSIVDAFENVYPNSFQLLIHPIWWVYEDKTTEEVWNRVIENNFEMSQKQYIETERAYGCKRALTLKTIQGKKK